MLRRATINDIKITYAWFCDPKVRSFSLSTKEVSFKQHTLWFKNTIKNPNVEYYIYEHEKKTIGSIRFDNLASKSAKINYLIDSSHWSKGFGTLILKKGIDLVKIDHPYLNSTCGLVLENNIASIKIFKKLNFKQISIKNNQIFFKKLYVNR